MRLPRESLSLVVLAAIALAACEPDTSNSTGPSNSSSSDSSAAPGAVPIAAFNAVDFKYHGPETLAAGLTEFQLSNEGKEPHQLQIVGVPADMTAEKIGAAMAIEGEGEAIPDWMVFEGGPNAIDPGESSSVFVDLAPGNYMIICQVPSPDGTVHAAKGMLQALTITEPAADTASGPAAAPAADLNWVGKEFAFGLSDESITAGSHVVSFRNSGEQTHEVTVVRLDKGASSDDILAAFGPDSKGPPPGTFLGGTAGIAPGASQSFAINLEPGRYALMCFFPDTVTGTPHTALGMNVEFEIP